MLDHEKIEALVRQAKREQADAVGDLIFGIFRRIKRFVWRS